MTPVSPSRPISPIYINSEVKVPQFRTDENKIHRIRCLVPYYARVVSVVSPSEIWIQHPNHISDRLTEILPPNSEPVDSGSLKKGMYVMAPLDETTLARSRILEVKNDKVLVRFIDHGSTNFFSSNDLFNMSLDLRTYPWQTVPVALSDVNPLNREFWSDEEVEALKTALRDYDMFWIRPQMTQKKIIDDGFYSRVTMFGLYPEDIDEIQNSFRSDFDLGDSIMEKFYTLLPSHSFTPLPVIDAFDQKLFPVKK
ncbi:hypothetical protein FO519_002799 [Halicephalobus sp. NKZ332]|nr:hypothetical protein FO519_002799 [Halicephalobus sp. NKZ332]